MLSEAGSVFWSFADVEEALVDAAELWLRSPGSGIGPRGRSEAFTSGSPFAADAPWQLLTREVRADINAEGLKRAEVDQLLARAAEGTPPPRSSGLDRAEVARRDQVSAWLLLVEDEDDRRLVAMGAMAQARTARRIDWRWVQRQMGGVRGREGLRKRYNRAITAIAQALTRQQVRLAA